MALHADSFGGQREASGKKMFKIEYRICNATDDLAPRRGLLTDGEASGERRMPDPTLWGLFVVASVVLLLTPGPAVL
jgi:hypothetical protein